MYRNIFTVACRIGIIVHALKIKSAELSYKGAKKSFFFEYINNLNKRNSLATHFFFVLKLLLEILRKNYLNIQ